MTMTPTQTKETFKIKFEEAKRNVLRSYDIRKIELDEIKKTFEGFYEDMVKVSPDFELVKIPNRSEYRVMVDGFPVETIGLNFFNYEIVYKGKLPETVSSSKVRIEVLQQYVTPRGSWRQKNLGWRVRTKLDWNDSPYYKSGRTAAKKVIEYVNTLWSIEKDRLFKQELRSRAFTELHKMFRLSIVDFGRPGNPHDSQFFTITNLNKTKIVVTYSYDAVNDKVDFKMVRNEIVIPDEISITSFVEKLGQL